MSKGPISTGKAPCSVSLELREKRNTVVVKVIFEDAYEAIEYHDVVERALDSGGVTEIRFGKRR